MLSFQLVFYFAILAAQVLTFQSDPGEDQTENLCLTKECYEAAYHIQKWMNPAFKPCDDFYEFTCGYWHTPDNKTLEKLYNSTLGEKKDMASYYLKKLLLNEQLPQGSKLYETLKKFTSSCIDEDAINARGVSPALDIISKAGGWPLLQQNWTGENFNLVDAEVASGGTLFPLDVVLSPDTNKLILRIDTPKVLKEYAELIFGGRMFAKKMIKIAEAFGGKTHIIQMAMKDMMKLKYNITMVFMTTKEEPKWYTLDQLNKEIDWVDWTHLFSGVFQDLPLSNNETILVKHPESLKRIGHLLDTSPKSSVANMMMWSVAFNLAPYLPSSVSSLVELPKSSTRLEYCTNFIKRSSLALVLLSYLASSTVEETLTAVKMTKDLVDELILDIQKLDWLDDETRKSAEETIRDIKLSIGFPKTLLDIENYYMDFKMDTANFLEAMVDSERWIKQKRLQQFLTNDESTDWMNLIKLVNHHLSPLAYYDLENQKIVVSGGFLHFVPLFNSKLPAYVNFGHLGSILAHELTHAIDTETDEKGRKVVVLRSWGNNSTKEIYDKKVKCVTNQYSSFNDTKYTNIKLNGNQTEDEDVADIGGFKLALRAYKRIYANTSNPEPRLPLLQQYSPEQMFMISAANAYCEISYYLKQSFLLQVDSHSLKEFRVKGMLMNSPDFADAFSCLPGDPMNPYNKCEVW